MESAPGCSGTRQDRIQSRHKTVERLDVGGVNLPEEPAVAIRQSRGVAPMHQARDDNSRPGPLEVRAGKEVRLFGETIQVFVDGGQFAVLPVKLLRRTIQGLDGAFSTAASNPASDISLILQRPASPVR